MSIKTKNIEVVDYNPDWPQMFEEESALIKQRLGNHCLDVHHIGSTSVPGLCAKPVLDILCIVDDLSVSLALQDLGYEFKGEVNIPLRYYFTNKTRPLRVNLHLVEPNHGFIFLNLCFRDYLRTHENARMAYAALKDQLLKDPKSFQVITPPFPGYTLGKNQFIKDILDKAEFEDFSMNFCLHDSEWEVYYRICGKQVADHTADNHYSFVLYRGTRIVAAAHVEFMKENEATLWLLTTDPIDRNQGFESQMMSLLEKWSHRQGRHLINVAKD